MFNTIDDLKVAGKRVLVRGDLNVPLKDGKVSDATRIERLVPTIQDLAAKGARVIVLSHFGRPKGKVVPEMSLAPVADALSQALGKPVAFAKDCVGAAAAAVVNGLADGDVALLENLRFHAGEEKNDPDFARKLASLGDFYVNDGFSVSHRAHASTEAIARLLPSAAGRNMQAELQALDAALGAPKRPVLAIVGGAMANTFLHALGTDVGKSLCEAELAGTAREIMAKADAAGCEIVLPSDVVIAAKLEAGAASETVRTAAVPPDKMILDIGPDSAAALAKRLESIRTLLWNGPLGAFEFPPFDAGTNAVARAVADLTRAGTLLSVAGGGDTVAALAHAGVGEAFSYVSTAGGAFLEWLEGKELPGVAALGRAAQ